MTPDTSDSPENRGSNDDDESLVGTTVFHEFEDQGVREGTIIDDTRSRDDRVTVEWDECLSPDDRVWSMDPDSLTYE